MLTELGLYFFASVFRSLYRLFYDRSFRIPDLDEIAVMYHAWVSGSISTGGGSATANV